MYAYIFLDRFTCRFHPRYHYRIYPFFFRRDTQHHAADDKREGGLYVRPAERHRCDTVRRVRESNPHEQVRTSPTGYIYPERTNSLLFFAFSHRGSLVKFRLPHRIHEWGNFSERGWRRPPTPDPPDFRARFSLDARKSIPRIVYPTRFRYSESVCSRGRRSASLSPCISLFHLSRLRDRDPFIETSY